MNDMFPWLVKLKHMAILSLSGFIFTAIIWSRESCQILHSYPFPHRWTYTYRRYSRILQQLSTRTHPCQSEWKFASISESTIGMGGFEVLLGWSTTATWFESVFSYLSFCKYPLTDHHYFFNLLLCHFGERLLEGHYVWNGVGCL